MWTSGVPLFICRDYVCLPAAHLEDNSNTAICRFSSSLPNSRQYASYSYTIYVQKVSSHPFASYPTTLPPRQPSSFTNGVSKRQFERDCSCEGSSVSSLTFHRKEIHEYGVNHHTIVHALVDGSIDVTRHCAPLNSKRIDNSKVLLSVQV